MAKQVEKLELAILSDVFITVASWILNSLLTCPGHDGYPTWFLNLFDVAVHDKLMFCPCKHILVHVHLLFLFSLCLSNPNDGIPGCNFMFLTKLQVLQPLKCGHFSQFSKRSHHSNISCFFQVPFYYKFSVFVGTFFACFWQFYAEAKAHAKYSVWIKT